MQTQFKRLKLIAAGLLLLLGIIFAWQNSAIVPIRFMAWSMEMSQALVIFLSGAAGVIIGFFFGTAFRITRRPGGSD